MTINYIWEIEKLDVQPEKAGLQNIVCRIHWNLIASEDQYTANQNGVTDVCLDENSEFTPYEELSKQQIITWLENELGKQVKPPHLQNVSPRMAEQSSQEEEVYSTQLELLKMDLWTRIRDMKTPPVVSPALPW